MLGPEDPEVPRDAAGVGLPAPPVDHPDAVAHLRPDLDRTGGRERLVDRVDPAEGPRRADDPLAHQLCTLGPPPLVDLVVVGRLK